MGQVCSSPMGMCERSGQDVGNIGMSPRKELQTKVRKIMHAGGDDLGQIDKGAVTNTAERKMESNKPLTLIDRRLQAQRSNQHNTGDYLKNFEADDDENNNTSKVTQKIFWSAVRSRKGTNDMQNSINSFKNKSTISGNLSMLSAALAMS